MPTAAAADADAESVDTTGLGFDKLDGILVRFGAHWKNLTVHKLFDVAYSQNLPDLNNLFSDGATRTQLKPDVIKRIRKQFLEIATIRATSTPDKTKIAPIINELFFYTKASRGVTIPIRTVQELADGLTSALDQGHASMDLYIDIGRLHFIAEPNPYNFDHFQLDTPFPTTRPPPAPAGPALDVNALVAALAAHTAALSSAASTSTSTTAQAGNSALAGSIPVTNIFNYRALPSDVRMRYDLHANRTMMTRRVMDVEFESTIPNMTLDPSGATMRTTLFYLDPW